MIFYLIINTKQHGPYKTVPYRIHAWVKTFPMLRALFITANFPTLKTRDRFGMHISDKKTQGWKRLLHKYKIMGGEFLTSCAVWCPAYFRMISCCEARKCSFTSRRRVRASNDNKRPEQRDERGKMREAGWNTEWRVPRFGDSSPKKKRAGNYFGIFLFFTFWWGTLK